MKSEDFSAKRKGKREYLNDLQTNGFVKELNQFFQNKVTVPKVRTGMQQEIETLINEEAFLFAQYLRNERQTWIPRIVSV